MDCNSTIFYQLRKTSCFRDSNPTGAKPIYRRARNLALASSRGHSPVARYPTLYQVVVDTSFPLHGRGKCGYWLSAKSCEVQQICSILRQIQIHDFKKQFFMAGHRIDMLGLICLVIGLCLTFLWKYY